MGSSLHLYLFTSRPNACLHCTEVWHRDYPLTLESLDVTSTVTVTRISKKQKVYVSKTTYHTHHAFLYISLPSLHDYDVNIRREQTTWTYDDEFLFLSLNLIFFVKNSTTGKFAYSWKSEWVGIITLKFQRTRSHFLSDVFAAVALVVS